MALRLGTTPVDWFEQWFPDAFALALVAVVIVYAASVGIGNSPFQAADEIGKMAARAGVKTVVITHLPATVDPKHDYKRYADGVKKNFSGQVFIANDLMEF
jgi:hypothetical protein